MSQAGELSVASGVLPTNVPTLFSTNAEPAEPAANELEILGTGTITTSGSGNTITISQTGPGAALQTLTPNSGAAVTPVANNINDQGLAANAGGNAFPLFSYNGGAGQLNWENRTYLTPYVVDASTTNGSKGTFTTIQGAINQASTDSATAATILIRPGTYTENILIPAGSNFRLVGNASKNSEFIYPGTFINGTITFTGTFPVLFISNLQVEAITDTSNDISLFADNCSFGFINISGELAVDCYQCYFSTSTIGNTGSGILNDCYFTSTLAIPSGSAKVIFQSCYFDETITLSATAQATFKECIFNAAPGINGSTSNTITCVNSIFQPISGNPVSFTGNCAFQNLINQSPSPAGMFAAGVVPQQLPSTIGNVYQATRSAISYTGLSTDVYIGITDTSIARTVSLPSSQIITNQIFIIKDEGGLAGTNNITISVVGGVKKIDGASANVINTNYGSIRVIYDGTNYFTW